MAHRRGNPNWGKAAPNICLPTVTEFEKQVRQLRLNERNFVRSNELRQWCEQNKNRSYIPEWLLKHWKISVDGHAVD